MRDYGKRIAYRNVGDETFIRIEANDLPFQRRKTPNQRVARRNGYVNRHFVNGKLVSAARVARQVPHQTRERLHLSKNLLQTQAIKSVERRIDFLPCVLDRRKS